MIYLPFTIAYGALTLAIVVLELIGVVSKRNGDTITENWRYIDTHSPPWIKFIWRVFTAGMLGWTLLHFGGNWG